MSQQLRVTAREQALHSCTSTSHSTRTTNTHREAHGYHEQRNREAKQGRGTARHPLIDLLPLPCSVLPSCSPSARAHGYLPSVLRAHSPPLAASPQLTACMSALCAQSCLSRSSTTCCSRCRRPAGRQTSSHGEADKSENRQCLEILLSDRLRQIPLQLPAPYN